MKDKREILNDVVIERIVKRRKDLRMSQEVMANLIHMSKSSYIRLENGEHPLTLEETEKIAEVLQTDFYTLTNKGNIFNNTSSTLICQGNNPTINIKLDDEQFEEILSTIYGKKKYEGITPTKGNLPRLS